MTIGLSKNRLQFAYPQKKATSTWLFTIELGLGLILR